MMLRVSGSTICTSPGVEDKAQCALNRQVAVEVIEGTGTRTIAKRGEELS